ncbi:long-chain-fatty-acid--CoA ligase [Streptomyces botrytidirepellens]|uniref:Long-chain fatty acid--CoA ligase n=1 Tax=Streptomyces botrytidirepellens TaxID=2486417 RepID=A0A3M8WZN2_9ACTN|nr:long-chain fatty acid--CoA ligase [Streptomyces botrytidirepellens]RNG34171.1 long-chain fatty acid--CoA ligase [Streptomyces botrytidirepellens]
MVRYNLASLLEFSVTRYPERTAIVFDGTRLSYAQLDAAANQVANLLVSTGIRNGDKVALSMPNLPYFPVIYYGILKAGATVVPLNVMLKAREIAYHLDDSDTKAYFAFEGTPESPIGNAARQAVADAPGLDLFIVDPTADLPWDAQPPTFDTVRTDEDDTAVLLYTSGTTGRPKGAEMRHRNMRDNALVSGELLGVTAGRPDTCLCVLPLFHSFGQTVVQNVCLGSAGTLVMLPRFNAATALHLMFKEQVTSFAGVPTMYGALLGALGDSVDVTALAANLRVAVAGGSALPREIHRLFKERFGITILEGYGLSETAPAAAFSVPGQEPRVGSIGVPIPGVEMKLINDDWSDAKDGPDTIGEIAIKGHNIMKGYYKRPQATAEAIRDGWFRSGDLARKDADGFYYIVDRSKDVIIRGGFNVYPREIEELLMEHPAVSLVAVIGVPHESYGEEIKAVVVKNTNDPTTEAELRAWAKDHLAAYKYPRIVEYVDALPMTSTGKILKRNIG